MDYTYTKEMEPQKVLNKYRTISLISHSRKILLRVILNRLIPQAEHILAEEQAGFRKNEATLNKF